MRARLGRAGAAGACTGSHGECPAAPAVQCGRRVGWRASSSAPRGMGASAPMRCLAAGAHNMLCFIDMRAAQEGYASVFTRWD
jgi:hypothetical protein